MTQIVFTTVDGLDPAELTAIARRLTRPNSDFQREVVEVATGKASSSTPIALWHEDGCLVAWAASHVWQEKQTLEQFTDERHRKRGIASALSAALIASGAIDRYEAIAVFSPSTASIAARLGLMPIRYERRGSDWVLA